MEPKKYRYGPEELNKILDQVSEFEVRLVDDPTLPEHGSAYLQRSLSAVRNYNNRLIFYIQTVGKQEKDLKIDVRTREADIDLKINMMLADDVLVRQQPSIEDRRAQAISKLESEYDEMAKIRTFLLDVQETMKLLRMKYRDLQQVSQDIKLQRQIVKDDREAWSHGDGGYVPPQRNKDGTVPDGMQPPIRSKIDPTDLLDPAKRPADLPEPVDAVHASHIAAFFANKPVRSETPTPQAEKPAGTVTYEDLLID